MKLSKLILTGNAPEPPKQDPLPGVLLGGIVLLILTVLIGGGIGYMLLSQRFPSLDLFEQHFRRSSVPTVLYDASGKTRLLTLAYEGIEGEDLYLCRSDGDGCIPTRFAEIVRQTVPDYARKMTEAVYPEADARMLRLLTAQVRQHFGEDRLLEWYLNRSWFGRLSFGLDAAAKLYLNKSGSELSDAECILMSTILDAPTLNPIDTNGAMREAYLNRLESLTQAGVFTPTERDELSRTNVTIFSPPDYRDGKTNDLITRRALDSAYSRFGREAVERGDMKLMTSEDSGLQDYLNCLLALDDRSDEEREEFCPLDKDLSEVLRGASAAAIVTDADDGAILAAVEVSAESDGTRSRRDAFLEHPLGTNINLFTALTAYSRGAAPVSMLWDLGSDTPEAMPDWENPDGISEHGPVSLKTALQGDLLRPLTALAETYGTAQVFHDAEMLGLPMTRESGLYEQKANPAALARALQPFAAGGMQTAALQSLRAVSAAGEITEIAAEKESILSPGLAFLMTETLKQDGTAEKTARVPGQNTIWVSLYSPQRIVVVCLDGSARSGAFIGGGNRTEEAAAAFARALLERASGGLTPGDWAVPRDVVSAKVCLPSGRLPSPACPETSVEFFLADALPYETDDYYIEETVNRKNRLLATRYTPKADLETVVFVNLPEKAKAWGAANGLEPVPEAYDPIPEELSADFTISEPVDFAEISNEELLKVIVSFDFPEHITAFQATLGGGMYPENWTEVCSGPLDGNGAWQLCTADLAGFAPGVYTLRVHLSGGSDRVYSAEKMIVIR